jgi:hypothetical protein
MYAICSSSEYHMNGWKGFSGLRVIRGFQHADQIFRHIVECDDEELSEYGHFKTMAVRLSVPVGDGKAVPQSAIISRASLVEALEKSANPAAKPALDRLQRSGHIEHEFEEFLNMNKEEIDRIAFGR